jgi:hypothetical protein
LLRNGDAIDVVFTDIRLKGRLNGWDVGEAARAARADIAVVYTSGQPVEPPRQVKGSVFIKKPYGPDEVTQVCHGLCGKSSI